MPNHELIKTIHKSRGYIHDYDPDRGARQIAADIERDFIVEPRHEELLAVGGPRHGETLTIQRTGTWVIAVDPVGRWDPAAGRDLDDELYRQHEYARSTIVTGSGESIDVLVHSRGPF